MGTNRISIIIPVYNTPTFLLKKCFDSIRNQSYKNIEVIIIDSSVGEETIQFIQKYVELDNRFVYFQSKKGVSIQRNIGISKSNGELIAFIDSDDYISADYLEIMYECLEKYGADIVYPRLVKETYENGELVRQSCLETKPVFEIITDKNFFIGTEHNRLVNPVKLYKRKLIGETRFREDLSHGEDMIFNYDLSKKGFKAIYCENAIYTFTAIQGTNAALKRLNKTSTKIVEVMYKLLKANKKNRGDNYDGMYFQFSYLFNTYYYAFVKNNKTFWMIAFLKYRLFYLRRNHTFKDIVYMLFPYCRKIIKNLFRMA